jgi:hypothetical protein
MADLAHAKDGTIICQPADLSWIALEHIAGRDLWKSQPSGVTGCSATDQIIGK